MNACDKQKIIAKRCFELGCCPRCTLRLIGFKKWHMYNDTKTVIKKLCETDDTIKWEENTVTCISCLSLLQWQEEPLFGEEIIEQIMASEFDFSSFQLHLTLPASITLRSELVINRLKSTLKSQKVVDFCFQSVYSVKNIFRSIMTDFITLKLNKPFDCNALFHISVSIRYDKVDQECKFLLDLCPQSIFPKKCKRSIADCDWSSTYFNHTSIIRCLATVDDQFLNNIPITSPLTDDLKLSSVECFNDSVFVAGRYLKFSRELSQTPWIIDGEKHFKGSVQELIEDQAKKVFKCDNFKFSASGREDVDVCMLGHGRPFVLELINPQVLKFDRDILVEFQKLVQTSTKDVGIRDLQIAANKDVQAKLKDAERSKTKTYEALCCISRPFTENDAQKLAAISNLVISQDTPVRVLHRRTLSKRQRTIYSMSTKVVVNQADSESQLFKLTLTTEAGTYIKEFVHSDFGRTSPNLASILGDCICDIIQLDVTVSKIVQSKISIRQIFLGSE